MAFLEKRRMENGDLRAQSHPSTDDDDDDDRSAIAPPGATTAAADVVVITRPEPTMGIEAEEAEEPAAVGGFIRLFDILGRFGDIDLLFMTMAVFEEELEPEPEIELEPATGTGTGTGALGSSSGTGSVVTSFIIIRSTNRKVYDENRMASMDG
ncbi:hypothetical protein H0H93_013368 [Arthromyces matolae]|nr:hypothetical protein H0H93_013368 [Arthromyces matolae]